VTFSQTNALALVELLGVLAFAFTGIIEARKKGMDLIGVYTVSMITAFGGGTVRDLMIGHYPLYWVQHSGYALMLLVFAIAAAPLSAMFYENPAVTKVFVTLDALGLGLFSTAGASMAHQAGCDFYISMLLGVVTGVFGGIIRDIICNEIPNVFRRSELYATCAVVGSAVFLICLYLGVDELPSTLVAIAFTTALRVVSIKYRLKLPF
jgi:uncharacterized membrane protein YeiH